MFVIQIKSTTELVDRIFIVRQVNDASAVALSLFTSILLNGVILDQVCTVYY